MLHRVVQIWTSLAATIILFWQEWKSWRQALFLPIPQLPDCLGNMYWLQGAVSFWEANTFSDRKEIPRILWNTKGPYRIYTCPPPVHRDMWRIELVEDSLGQQNPVRAPFQQKPWRFILILSSFPRLGLPSGFSNISGSYFSCSMGRQVAVCAAIHTTSLLYATGVSPLFSFSHSTNAVVAASVSLLLATIQ